MIAAPLVIACCLYLIGERADRIHAQRSGGNAASATAKGPVRHAVFPIASSVSRPVPARGLYRGHSAAFYAWQLRIRTRQLQHARQDLRHRWTPTVTYALTLASAVFGVPYSELAAVSHCESTWNPFARNGRQLGLFQLGWRPFGLDPFDPIANALSAAQTVQHDGSWRQWVCKP